MSGHSSHFLHCLHRWSSTPGLWYKRSISMSICKNSIHHITWLPILKQLCAVLVISRWHYILLLSIFYLNWSQLWGTLAKWRQWAFMVGPEILLVWRTCPIQTVSSFEFFSFFLFMRGYQLLVWVLEDHARCCSFWLHLDYSNLLHLWGTKGQDFKLAHIHCFLEYISVVLLSSSSQFLEYSPPFSHRTERPWCS